MNAKEYFDKEYDDKHIEMVVPYGDYISLYGLMEAYADHKNKELIKEIDELKLEIKKLGAVIEYINPLFGKLKNIK